MINSRIAFLLLVLCFSYVNAKDYTIELCEEDFDEAIKSNNYFVAFDNRERATYIKFDEFQTFWKKISRVCNKNETGDPKIASVNCQRNSKLCQRLNITEVLIVKFFAKDGEKFDWKPMAKFFNNTVQEAIKTYELEESTMNKLKSGKHFVKFHAPDCSRCESLAPVWSKLESYYSENQDVSLFSVDCKDQQNVCDFFNIITYPSVVYIGLGEIIKRYMGDRSSKDLKEFIGQSSKVEENIKTTLDTFVKEKAVFDVTPENFQELISKDYSLIYFSLKNCKYCQALNKIYDTLAEKFIGSRNITIAMANCGAHPSFCIKEAKGCPTITVYGNGVLLKKDYHEDHSLQGLHDLIVAYASGGAVFDEWKKGEAIKRAARKEKEAAEAEAKAKINLDD